MAKTEPYPGAVLTAERPNSSPTRESPQRAGMGQETSSRRQAHSTGHQRCHKRNAGKTNQLDIDDPTESVRQSFTDLGQLSLPQRDRPEDVGTVG